MTACESAATMQAAGQGLPAQEAEDLWGEFQDVVKTLYCIPAVAMKMEGKLKHGFFQAAGQSKSEFKFWLDKFVKAGRLRQCTRSGVGRALARQLLLAAATDFFSRCSRLTFFFVVQPGAHARREKPPCLWSLLVRFRHAAAARVRAGRGVLLGAQGASLEFQGSFHHPMKSRLTVPLGHAPPAFCGGICPCTICFFLDSPLHVSCVHVRRPPAKLGPQAARTGPVTGPAKRQAQRAASDASMTENIATAESVAGLFF
jgi:hypothetical protein